VSQKAVLYAKQGRSQTVADTLSRVVALPREYDCWELGLHGGKRISPRLSDLGIPEMPIDLLAG
jgi:hypothetical protein